MDKPIYARRTVFSKNDQTSNVYISAGNNEILNVEGILNVIDKTSDGSLANILINGVPLSAATRVFSVALSDLTDANHLMAPTNRDLLIYNNGTHVWDAGKIATTDLTDLNITSVANNQLLAYDSGTSKWVNIDPTSVASAINLNDLNDVFIDEVVDNQSIKWTSNNRWENCTVDLANSLNDVILSNVQENDLLYYTANKWTNQAINFVTSIPWQTQAISSLTDVTLLSLQNNDILAYNSATQHFENVGVFVPSSLNDLSDVNLISPVTNGDYLSFTTDGIWYNKPFPALVTSIQDLVDVGQNPLPFMNYGDVLTWTGSQYEHMDLSANTSQFKAPTNISTLNFPIGIFAPLIFNGSEWTASQLRLEDCSNVFPNTQINPNTNVPSLSNGQILMAHNGYWKASDIAFVTASTPTLSLSDLSDCSITVATRNTILKSNASNIFGEVEYTLGSINNVHSSVDTANSDDILVYTGSSWRAVPFNKSLEQLNNTYNDESIYPLLYDSGSQTWTNLNKTSIQAIDEIAFYTSTVLDKDPLVYISSTSKFQTGQIDVSKINFDNSQISNIPITFTTSTINILPTTSLTSRSIYLDNNDRLWYEHNTSASESYLSSTTDYLNWTTIYKCGGSVFNIGSLTKFYNTVPNADVMILIRNTNNSNENHFISSNDNFITVYTNSTKNPTYACRYINYHSLGNFYVGLNSNFDHIRFCTDVLTTTIVWTTVLFTHPIGASYFPLATIYDPVNEQVIFQCSNLSSNFSFFVYVNSDKSFGYYNNSLNIFDHSFTINSRLNYMDIDNNYIIARDITAFNNYYMKVSSLNQNTTVTTGYFNSDGSIKLLDVCRNNKNGLYYSITDDNKFTYSYNGTDFEYCSSVYNDISVATNRVGSSNCITTYDNKIFADVVLNYPNHILLKSDIQADIKVNTGYITTGINALTGVFISSPVSGEIIVYTNNGFHNASNISVGSQYVMSYVTQYLNDNINPYVGTYISLTTSFDIEPYNYLHGLSIYFTTSVATTIAPAFMSVQWLDENLDYSQLYLYVDNPDYTTFEYNKSITNCEVNPLSDPIAHIGELICSDNTTTEPVNMSKYTNFTLNIYENRQNNSAYRRNGLKWPSEMWIYGYNGNLHLGSLNNTTYMGFKFSSSIGFTTVSFGNIVTESALVANVSENQLLTLPSVNKNYEISDYNFPLLFTTNSYIQNKEAYIELSHLFLHETVYNVKIHEINLYDPYGQLIDKSFLTVSGGDSGSGYFDSSMSDINIMDNVNDSITFEKYLKILPTTPGLIVKYIDVYSDSLINYPIIFNNNFFRSPVEQNTRTNIEMLASSFTAPYDSYYKFDVLISKLSGTGTSKFRYVHINNDTDGLTITNLNTVISFDVADSRSVYMKKDSYIYLECSVQTDGDIINTSASTFEVSVISTNIPNNETVDITYENDFDTSEFKNRITFVSAEFDQYSFSAIKDITTDGKLDILVNKDATNYYYKTTDLTTIQPTSQTLPGTYTNLVFKYNENQDTFIGGSAACLLKGYNIDNSISFTTQALPGHLTGISDIAFCDRYTIAVHTNSNVFGASMNLISWATTISPGTVTGFHKMAYNQDNKQLAIISNHVGTAYNVLVTSSNIPIMANNVLSFQTKVSGTGIYLNDICYASGSIDKFIAIGGVTQAFYSHYSSSSSSFTTNTLSATTSPLLYVDYSPVYDKIMMVSKNIYAINDDANLTTFTTGVVPFNNPSFLKYFKDGFYISNSDQDRLALLKTDTPGWTTITTIGNNYNDSYINGNTIFIGSNSDVIEIGSKNTTIKMNGNILEDYQTLKEPLIYYFANIRNMADANYTGRVVFDQHIENYNVELFYQTNTVPQNNKASYCISPGTTIGYTVNDLSGMFFCNQPGFYEFKINNMITASAGGVAFTSVALCTNKVTENINGAEYVLRVLTFNTTTNATYYDPVAGSCIVYLNHGERIFNKITGPGVYISAWYQGSMTIKFLSF